MANCLHIFQDWVSIKSFSNGSIWEGFVLDDADGEIADDTECAELLACEFNKQGDACAALPTAEIGDWTINVDDEDSITNCEASNPSNCRNYIPSQMGCVSSGTYLNRCYFKWMTGAQLSRDPSVLSPRKSGEYPQYPAYGKSRRSRRSRRSPKSKKRRKKEKKRKSKRKQYRGM